MEGRLHLTASEYDAANIATGSSCNQPVVAIPAAKQSNGTLHGPQGHTTHMIAQIVGSIRGFQVTCVWKDRVAAFEGELNDLKERVEMDANGSGDDR